MKFHNAKYRWRMLAVSAITIFVGGCFFLTGDNPAGIHRKEPSGLRFSHKVHHDDYGVTDSCERCHGKYGSSDQMTMPDHTACGAAGCHAEDVDQSAKSTNCELCHENPAHSVKRTTRPGFADVINSHAAHAAAQPPVECSDCHPGSKEWNPGSVIAMDECSKCHEKRGLEDIAHNCAACHELIRKGRKPPTHHKRFVYDHSEAAEGFAYGEDTRCMACHEEGDCNECHQEMKPRGHNNHWRIRSHGLHAMGERERCAVCHRSDFCNDCHAESTPRSHLAASWASGRNRHCVRCHLDISDSSCNMCHSAGEVEAGHADAPARPGDAIHGSAVSCSRTCHLNAGLSIHLDPGEDCTLCHP